MSIRGNPIRRLIARTLANSVALILFLLLAVPTASAGMSTNFSVTIYADNDEYGIGGTGSVVFEVRVTQAPTDGELVTLNYTLPDGFSVTYAGGDGWDCPQEFTCETSDVLNTGYHYISVIFGIEENAQSGAFTASIFTQFWNNDVAPVPVSVTVMDPRTTTTVTPVTAAYGDRVTLTATVSPRQEGEVVFYVDGLRIAGKEVNTNTGEAQVEYQVDRLKGSYALTANFRPYNSQIQGSSDEAVLKVVKIPLTIKTKDDSRTYGAANPVSKVDYIGPDEETGSFLIGTLDFDTDADVKSAIGEYDVLPYGLTSHRYDITYEKGILEVTKAPLGIVGGRLSRPYGEDNPETLGTMTEVFNGDAITPRFETLATAASPVDDYTIVAEAVGSNETLRNYDVTEIDGTLTITKAELTITAKDETRVYGDANPSFTGTVEGRKNTDFIDGNYEVEAEVDETAGVGSYTIFATLGANDGSQVNYELERVDGTLTIEPRELIVTIRDESRQVGKSNPEFACELTGLMPWDVGVVDVSCSSTADTDSPTGPYDITAKLEGPEDRQANYALPDTTGTLTITPAPSPSPGPSPSPTPAKVTVTVNSATRTYGAKNPEFTATVAGLPSGEKLNLAFSTTATESSGVGTYPITATATPENKSANFTVDVIPGTLTVEKAALTVTPKDAARNQGAENPPLTGTITGIQNGDPITATYATTATSSSAPGTYPIKATLVDPQGRLANYSVTLREGVLTVGAGTQAPPAVSPSFAEASDAQVQAAIAQAAATGSTPRVVLQPDATSATQGAMVSAEALQLIAQAGGEVQVDTAFGSLLLPAQMLEQFAHENPGSALFIQFEDRGSMGQAATGPGHSAASPTVEVTVVIREGDGTTHVHDSFTVDLTLTLPLADASADAELAGIYRFETDASGGIIGVTYVGGELAADGQSISVARDHLSLYGVLVYDRDYKDVTPDHWAYRSIKVMTSRYVVQGVGEDLFAPERTVTRAEFAAMVARAWSLSIPADPALRFADVAADKWYAATMSAVVQAGLMTPEAGNSLRPDVPITRQEMAMVIARAMERFYPEAKLPDVDTEDTLVPFGDGSEVSAPARADMAKLVAAGLIRGRAADSLAPNGNTTRAEAATLIRRLLDWGRK